MTFQSFLSSFDRSMAISLLTSMEFRWHAHLYAHLVHLHLGRCHWHLVALRKHLDSILHLFLGFLDLGANTFIFIFRLDAADESCAHKHAEDYPDGDPVDQGGCGCFFAVLAIAIVIVAIVVAPVTLVVSLCLCLWG